MAANQRPQADVYPLESERPTAVQRFLARALSRWRRGRLTSRPFRILLALLAAVALMPAYVPLGSARAITWACWSALAGYLTSILVWVLFRKSPWTIVWGIRGAMLAAGAAFHLFGYRHSRFQEQPAIVFFGIVGGLAGAVVAGLSTANERGDDEDRPLP